MLAAQGDKRHPGHTQVDRHSFHRNVWITPRVAAADTVPAECRRSCRRRCRPRSGPSARSSPSRSGSTGIASGRRSSSGLPIAAITQVSAGQSLTAQMVVLWVATPFLTAAYVRAIVLASPEPLERDALVRAFVDRRRRLPARAGARAAVRPAGARVAGAVRARRPRGRARASALSRCAGARPPSRRRGLRPRARLAVRARDRLLRDAGDARRPPARSGGRGGADRRVHRRPRHLAAPLHRAGAALLRPGRPRRRLGPPREEEA